MNRNPNQNPRRMMLMQRIFAFDLSGIIAFTRITAMLLETLSGFQPLQDIIPGVLAMLLELIDQSRNPRRILQSDSAVLVPDAMVIFVAIMGFIENSPLAQIDIQDIMSVFNPAKVHLESHECISCAESVSESESISHMICSFCGNILCSSCFLRWRTTCLQQMNPMKRKITCPTCRSQFFGLSLQSRMIPNTECWASIVFALIFGKDFKSFHELQERSKKADGFPDPANLDEIWGLLHQEKRKLMFAKFDLGRIQVLSFHGAAGAAGAADVAADVAADAAADGDASASGDAADGGASASGAAADGGAARDADSFPEAAMYD
jgi:hypothetical protein